MNSSPKCDPARFTRLGARSWMLQAVMAALLLGIVLAWLGATATAQNPGTEAANLRAIEEVALDYLEGGRDADFERLSGAFHESARLQFVKDGQYTEWAIGDYLNGRKGTEPREAKLKVHSVDLAGSCAVAKVESDYGQVGFVDYLSLLKIDGEWVIVNKVFHRR